MKVVVKKLKELSLYEAKNVKGGWATGASGPNPDEPK